MDENCGQTKHVKPWMQLSQLTDKVLLEETLANVNTALLTIPTTTFTETNELEYATAKVIREILGYKIKKATCRECFPWRRRLEAKFKKAWRDVTWLTEVQWGVVRDRSWMEKKYNKRSINETLETAKKRLTALAARLKRYNKEAEAKRIYKTD